MTINALYNKFKAVDTSKIITEVATNNAPLLGEINLSQLYAGKTRFGIDLSPTYLEDPYFDDKGGLPAAYNYAKWKNSITPSSERGEFIPNLIINGFYYASRRVTVNGANFVFGADYKEDEIRGKYGPGIDGLGGKYKKEFLDTVGPQVREQISSATGLKFTK